eukprot:TRINITY_DN10078_c0_g1_i1.p1 TRINITY_DN10078_c0_g1~~TRINITY_DN10078_c0_g1_i1.p1  ORF type:complete len:716 (+),score=165.98 TRINITY_DN10078_c0_g1_i1:79-2148(+)
MALECTPCQARCRSAGAAWRLFALGEGAAAFIPRHQVASALRLMGLHPTRSSLDAGLQNADRVSEALFRALVHAHKAAKFTAGGLMECFATYDTDGSGTLDREELRNVLESGGEHFSDAELAAVFAAADANGDGRVDCAEFIAWALGSGGDAGGDSDSSSASGDMTLGSSPVQSPQSPPPRRGSSGRQPPRAPPPQPAATAAEARSAAAARAAPPAALKPAAAPAAPPPRRSHAAALSAGAQTAITAVLGQRRPQCVDSPLPSPSQRGTAGGAGDFPSRMRRVAESIQELSSEQDARGRAAAVADGRGLLQEADSAALRIREEAAAAAEACALPDQVPAAADLALLAWVCGGAAPPACRCGAEGADAGSCREAFLRGAAGSAAEPRGSCAEHTQVRGGVVGLCFDFGAWLLSGGPLPLRPEDLCPSAKMPDLASPVRDYCLSLGFPGGVLGWIDRACGGDAGLRQRLCATWHDAVAGRGDEEPAWLELPVRPRRRVAELRALGEWLRADAARCDPRGPIPELDGGRLPWGWREAHAELARAIADADDVSLFAADNEAPISLGDVCSKWATPQHRGCSAPRDFAPGEPRGSPTAAGAAALEAASERSQQRTRGAEDAASRGRGSCCGSGAEAPPPAAPRPQSEGCCAKLCRLFGCGGPPPAAPAPALAPPRSVGEQSAAPDGEPADGSPY